MKRILFAIVLAAAVLAGCSKNNGQVIVKGYEIKGIEGVDFGKGSLSATVKVSVDLENQMSRECSMESLKAVMHNKSGKNFADIVLEESVVIEKDFNGKLEVPLKASFSNPLSIISSGLLSGGKFDPDGLTADIDITFKSGIFSKEIHKKDIPLGEMKDYLNSNFGQGNEND